MIVLLLLLFPYRYSQIPYFCVDGGTVRGEQNTYRHPDLVLEQYVGGMLTEKRSGRALYIRAVTKVSGPDFRSSTKKV